MAGLLLLIFYRREKKKTTAGEPEADQLPFSDGGILKRIRAVDSVSQREQQLQKAWESREENRLEEFDYRMAEEWEPVEPPISDQDKEAISHFMEQMFNPLEEVTPEDQLLAGGEYIDEQWIEQQLNTGEMENIQGTEVYFKQKKNIEEAIASGRYNEAVSKLLTF